MKTEYHLVVTSGYESFYKWATAALEKLGDNYTEFYHQRSKDKFVVILGDTKIVCQCFTIPFDVQDLKGLALSFIYDPEDLIEIFPEEWQSILRSLIRRLP